MFTKLIFVFDTNYLQNSIRRRINIIEIKYMDANLCYVTVFYANFKEDQG